MVNKRIVIPDGMKNDILAACHDDPTSSHLGFGKLLLELENVFIGTTLEEM